MTLRPGFVLPISQLLDPSSWPRDFFGPPRYYSPLGTGTDNDFNTWLDGVFGQLFFSDYQALDGSDGVGFHVNLWIKGSLALSIAGIYGFDFVVGSVTTDGWVRIPATVKLGANFELLLHRVDTRVRFPRDIFRRTVYDADPFAEEPFRVEVPLTGRLRLDAAFDVNFEPESPVSFGPIELLESGFLLTIQNAVLDLSREQKVLVIAQAGLPDDFRGFFAQKVVVQPPPYLDNSAGVANNLGEVPRATEFYMENVGIGTGGLHGTLGMRQRIAENVPPADRPTIVLAADSALLVAEPNDGATQRGQMRSTDVAHVLGKTANDAWYLVQLVRREANELSMDIGGPGWVEAARVKRLSGNFNLIPIVPEKSTDPFPAGGFLTLALGSVPLRFEQFYIVFKESLPIAIGIKASLLLKDFWVFRGNEALAVTLSADSRLDFTLRLATTLPPDPLPDTSRADTFSITKQDVIVIRVDGLEFAVKRVSGPPGSVDQEQWPWHVLLDLTVFFRWSFSKRNAAAGDLKAISLTGLGWSDEGPAFPKSASLKLASGSGDNAFASGLKVGGLAFSLDSIGAGVESGGAAFISLAGAVAHYTGFKAKGMLGLRFRWRGDDYLGVAFEKAALQVDSKTIEGELKVEWVDQAVPTPTGFEQREGWRGRGRFKMKVPPKVFVNLEAAFGDEPVTHTYFFLDIGSATAGIPIGPLAFYGISGLLGYNFTPDKATEESWYADWFRDKAPKMSAVAVEKWRVERDAIAGGLGTTIGTLGDKGYKFSAKVVFIYAEPGPLMLFAGHGNMLTALEELSHPEKSMLALLIVYDGAADTFSVNAEVQYEEPKPGSASAAEFGAGSMYSAYGLVDLFFDLARSGNWHIYLGERAPEKRVRAELVKFLRVDAYLMIDPSAIELGASVGWDWRKKWGPLRVELAAWIEGVLGYVYEPKQLYGALRIGGHARLSAYGFGTGITLGADLAAGAPNPWFYHVVMVFKLELPWFLPDIKVTAEWGDRKPYLPPPPLALRSAALVHDQPIADFTTTLYPNLDPDGDRLYLTPVPQAYDEMAAVAASPLVPLDAMPSIGFGHAFNDMTGLVDNPTGVTYTEAFADEGFFRYDLTRVQLWKRPRGSNASWTLLDERAAGTGGTPIDWSSYDNELHIFGQTKLYGKLVLDTSSGEALPFGLQFWAKTPFHIHATGDQQVEDTVEVNSSYPCVPLPPKPTTECAGYAALLPGQPLAVSYLLGRVGIHSAQGGRVIKVGSQLVGSYNVGSPGCRLRIVLPERATWLRIRLLRQWSLSWWAGREGTVVASKAGDVSDVIAYSDPRGVDWIEFLDPTLTPEAASSKKIAYEIIEVCFQSLRAMQDFDVALEAAAQVGAAYPAGVDIQAVTLLEPDQDYKLGFTTEVLYSEDSAEWQTRETFVQHTYFKTAGPPGLYPTSSELRDLVPYVHHAVPANGADPVYRGYDVRVAFRDDAAVRGMYARSLEELRLVISDGSQGLMQSVDGRPELLTIGWQRDVRIQANYQLGLWWQVLDQSPCITPGAYGGGDVVTGTPVDLLAPERTYRATLELASSPSFRRDRFEPSDLAAMIRVDDGTIDGPSNWGIEDGRLVQRSAIRGTPAAGVATAPGAALIFGDSAWRNYQVGATFEASVGHVGLIAGYRDAQNYYLATVHVETNQVEIIRVSNGLWTSLGLRTASGAASASVHSMTLIATGEWLQVVLDDEQLEPVYDDAHPRGRAGVFTAGAPGTIVSQLSVQGVSLFDFTFTTSRFAHFQEHVASFQGPPARLRTGGSLGDVIADIAVALSHFPARDDSSDQADRQRGEVFDAIADALNLPIGEPAEVVDITSIESDEGLIGWLFESPEPMRWRDRTSLAVLRQQINWDVPWLDDETLRLHPEGWRLSERRVSLDEAVRPLPLPGRRMLRLDELGKKNLGALKLTDIELDSEGRYYLELLVGAPRDLGGIKIQLRGAHASYTDFFTFPSHTLVKKGELLRIYASPSPAVMPYKRPNTRLFYAGVEGLAEAAEQGTVARIVNGNGIVEEVFPYLPHLVWTPVDPGRIRLIHTPDTRKAMVFIAGPMGLPEAVQPGEYRFDLTFLRDLGVSESSWSYHGSTDPEVASIAVTVSEAVAVVPA